MLVAEGAGMTSGNDDLEQELRRNLKLRRELGAKAAKGKAALSAKQGGGIAYRLGWVLYWACLVVAGMYAAAFLWWASAESGVVEDIRGSPYLVLLIAAPPVLLYGLGRAFRYVLSAE
jgi:hypothetical protein